MFYQASSYLPISPHVVISFFPPNCSHRFSFFNCSCHASLLNHVVSSYFASALQFSPARQKGVSFFLLWRFLVSNLPLLLYQCICWLLLVTVTSTLYVTIHIYYICISYIYMKMYKDKKNLKEKKKNWIRFSEDNFVHRIIYQC